MIIHYLKVALRNIFKDRIYSLINLIGLSVAVACCFLLIFWIKFELTFEDCHPKAGRIYKVLEVEKRTDGIHNNDYIRPGIANQLKESFPEIEASIIVSHEQLTFIYEEGKDGIMTDYTTTVPDYLDMFSCEYIEGSKEYVLSNKGAIMSEETARKFFGEESAIGKTVSFGNSLKCTIQAVVRVPQSTHMKFDILDFNRPSNFGVHYILINEKVKFSEEAKQRMSNFLNTARASAFEENRKNSINTINTRRDAGNMSEEQAQQMIDRLLSQTPPVTENKLAFLPLKDVHLYSPKELAVNTNRQIFGDLKQIYLFSVIALLILAIAIVNYVNTSTARAMNRMREVGVRKVTGSTQRQLILRFLSDAFIISAVSIVIAMIVSKWLFPQFSILMGNRVTYLLDFNTILIALVVCLLITILSGGYAAFYLSSFDPVTVLRGDFRPGSKENLRKILTGFQFFLSIGMLISTLIIYRQIQYMSATDTGVDRKNILIIDTSLWYQAEDFIQVIKQENPNIIDATIANVAPYNAQWSFSGISWEGSPEAVKEVAIARIFCDYHYADVFGLQVIDGEFIQPGWGWWQNADEKSFNMVINESFRKMMGVENPIGTTIGGGKIIGIVKDFNFKPLKEPITPLIISFNPETSNKLYIKTTGYNKKETIDYIREKYKEMGGVIQKGRPFMYSTVEDDYNGMYKSELRTMKMMTVFSVLSLCLSIMGIFGMVSFMVEKRTKEIAIRRINGAETKDVIFLFLLNFAKIIGVACVIAIPVSYFILLRWIQTYAFRISLSWWIFVLVPLAVSLITAVQIAMQVFLTTRQNPARAVVSD